MTPQEILAKVAYAAQIEALSSGEIVGRKNARELIIKHIAAAIGRHMENVAMVSKGALYEKEGARLITDHYDLYRITEQPQEASDGKGGKDENE